MKRKVRQKRTLKNTHASPLKRSIVIWGLVIVFLVIVIKLWQNYLEYNIRPIYATFYNEVIEDKVSHAVLTGDKVKGRYKTTYKNGKNFVVQIPVQDPSVYEALREHIAHFQIQNTNTFLSNIIILSIIPLVVFIGLIWFLVSSQVTPQTKRKIPFVKRRARLKLIRNPNVSFADVAGVEEAKEELQEIVEFLKDPHRFQKLGGRMPKGVLLIGPPGTGKTLLAKAIAGEAHVPFFSISGSDFVELFAGLGALRVRNMFSKGKRHAPCIIFLDEIDAVGRSRSINTDSEHGEREQTLNALLVEMDGFNTQKGIIIIAATNRPDILDAALLRPGRFDRQIVLDLPDLEGRKEILKTHMHKIVTATSVDLDHIARSTSGFSGAELANLVNEAALLAARLNKSAVETTDLQEARDKVKWGTERRTKIMNEEDRSIAAFHEAGHALTIHYSPNSEPLHKISIIPRGIGFLGMTISIPKTDSHTHTRQKLLTHITALMGGRAAEEIIFNDISTGSTTDIQHATYLARKMVCEWGMSEKLGPIQLCELDSQSTSSRNAYTTAKKIFFSNTLAVEIDNEIKYIIDSSYDNARKILLENRDTLQKLANALLQKEVLSESDIKELIEETSSLKKNETTV